MRRKKKQIIEDVIGYVFFYAVLQKTFAVPAFLYPFISRFHGRILYSLVPSLRRKIRKNLIAAYGNRLSPEERSNLTKRIVMENLFFFLEWAYWLKLPPERTKRFITWEGKEILDTLKREKTPVVVMSGHVGDFSLMIASLIYAGFPLTWIARDANNPYLARLMDRLRRKKGIYGIDKTSVNEAIHLSQKWLRKGNFLCLLVDQHSGKGVEVDFFGKRVEAPSGAALFARKYNAAVVGVFISRQKEFHHKITVEGPYELVRTENSEADIRTNTQLFYDRIEYHVRQNPGGWFTWMHRRFR